MIRLFEIQNKVIIPTEHCYMIKWLKDIMDEYPENYMKIYAYLFYMRCPSPDNPYFNLPEEDLEETVLEAVDADFSPEDDMIVEALDKMEVLFETPSVRAHNGLKKAMDAIATYMGNTAITDGKDGNIGQIRQMAKDFDNIRQSYKGVAKDLKDEQEAHVRGGQDLAYDQ